MNPQNPSPEVGMTPPGDPGVQARRVAMGLLARATPAEFEAGLAGFEEARGAVELRRPEMGLVMMHRGGIAPGKRADLARISFWEGRHWCE